MDQTPEPNTVEEAQEQIERARAALGVAPTSTATAAGPAERAEAPTRAASAPPPQEEVDAADKREHESPCDSACRALGSMRRAVGALCRLAGAEDARCVDAHRTLDASEARVHAQGCSC